MDVPHTTTSCGWHRARSFDARRALVGFLVVVSAASSAAAQTLPSPPPGPPGAPPVRTPPVRFRSSLVPAERAWLTKLDAGPSAGVAFGEALAVLPLRSGELVALGIGDGALRWKRAAIVTASPAIDEERVYVAEDGRLSAISTVTGDPLWTTSVESTISAPLTALGGWLITVSPDHQLTARNGKTGEAVWTQPLPEEPTAAPVIAGTHVYVPLASAHLLTFDIRSGALVWDRAFRGAAGPPLVVDERVYVGSTDNFLYCLEATDGRELWRWRTGGDVLRPPVADATHLYFASLDNMIRAIDRHSGNLRWKAALPARAVSGLLLVGDDLVVGALSPDVRIFSAISGRPVDRIAIPTELLAGPPRLINRAPADLNLIIVVGTDGQVIAFRQNRRLPLVPLNDLPGTPVTLNPPDSVTPS